MTRAVYWIAALWCSSLALVQPGCLYTGTGADEADAAPDAATDTDVDTSTDTDTDADTDTDTDTDSDTDSGTDTDTDSDTDTDTGSETETGVDWECDPEIFLDSDCLAASFPFDGNADDVSGLENHCSVEGATLIEDRFGAAESAYGFDGVDDYLARSYVADCGLFPNDDPLTYVVWIRSDEISSDGRLVLSTHFDGIGGGYNMYYSNQSVGCSVHPGDSDFGVGGGAVGDGLWHQVVCMWSTDQMHLYVDGVLEDTSSAVGSVAYPGGPAFKLGHTDTIEWDYYDSYFFEGGIDDVRIYGRALSDDEIQDLYHEGGWPLDDADAGPDGGADASVDGGG